jgi:hypothetical protein
MAKIIKLSAPRLIDGQMRYPIEGAISVSDNDAANILADEAGEEVPSDNPKATKPAKPD